MAIAFDKADSANSGGGTSATVSLAAAASNECAIILVFYTNINSFNALTVNGSATGITQIGSEFSESIGSGASTRGKWRAYYLYNPPTSSAAYTFTITNGGDPEARIYVSLYSGTATNPADSSGGGELTSAGTSFSLSTTVVASNCWLVSAARRADSGTLSASTGSTLRDASNVANVLADSNGTVATGSRSMTYSCSLSSQMAGFIVSIKPVVPDVTVTPSVLAATFSVPAATITAIKNVAVAASVLAATVSIPSPAVTGNAAIAPAPAAATFSIPPPTVVIADTSATPGVLSATFSLPSPDVSGNAIVAPDPLSIVASIPAPTITTVFNLTITPSPLSLVLSVLSPLIRANIWANQPRNSSSLSNQGRSSTSWDNQERS